MPQSTAFPLTSIEEAQKRAALWSEKDPFPEIPPSLLSSDDIAKYAEVTGMIYPFAATKEFLKTASFGVKLGHNAYEFKENGGYKQIYLNSLPVTKGRRYLEVKANSIVFVEVNATFNLPKYIALRFNLSITHVHRGMLLGTGPLVDPDFSGNLIIPIHNLTSYPHLIDVNDNLIWVEFTKTTYKKEDDERNLTNMDSAKKNRTSIEYIDRARKHPLSGRYLPIQSSIPVAVEEANRNSAEALKVSRRVSGQFWGFGVGGAILFFVGFFIIMLTEIYTNRSFMQSAYDVIDNQEISVLSDVRGAAYADIGSLVGELQNSYVVTSEALAELTRRVKELEAENAALKMISLNASDTE